MIIPSSKPIKFSCECIANKLYFFCIHLHQKMTIFQNSLNICIFYQYGIMVVLFQEIF
jgi:hypothetical protein